MRWCALLAVLVPVPLAAWAQAQPDPQAMALYERVLKAYDELESWEALVVVTVEGPQTLTETFRAWYAHPWLKVEGMGAFRETTILVDYAGNFLTRVGEDFIIEEEDVDPSDLPLKLPVHFLPRDLVLEAWSRELSDEGELWGLDGKAILGGLVEAKITIWVDPSTLLIRKVLMELVGGDRLTAEVREFLPNTEVPPEVFELPPRARRITLPPLHPQAKAIAKQALSEYQKLGSFYVHMVSEPDRSESIHIWYSEPFAREERQVQPGPHPYTLTLTFTRITDFEKGVDYLEHSGQWEAYEAWRVPPKLRALQALNLHFADAMRFVGLEEEVLEGRPTWKITGESSARDEESGDVAFGLVLWVDKQTHLIVQKREIFHIQRKKHVQTYRVVEFRPGVEVPAEKFVVPEGIPVEKLEIRLGVGVTEEELGEKAAEGVTWEPYSEERLEQAKSQGKLILLYFSADWCLPCLEFEENAWRDTRIIEEAQRFVRLKVDLSDWRSPKTRALERQYKVWALPTTLILDSQGRELARLEGAVPAWRLLSFLRSPK